MQNPNMESGNSPPFAPRLLIVKQAADYCSCAFWAIRQALWTKDLSACVIVHRQLIDRAAQDSFIDNRLREHASMSAAPSTAGRKRLNAGWSGVWKILWGSVAAGATGCATGFPFSAGEGLTTIGPEYPGTPVTEEGLKAISTHLESLDPAPYNGAMLEELHNILANGEDATGAYQDFYLHELEEVANMAEGMDYQPAHDAALQTYGQSPYGLYSPEVIEQFSELFNANYLNYWGTAMIFGPVKNKKGSRSVRLWLGELPRMEGVITERLDFKRASNAASNQNDCVLICIESWIGTGPLIIYGLLGLCFRPNSSQVAEGSIPIFPHKNIEFESPVTPTRDLVFWHLPVEFAEAIKTAFMASDDLSSGTYEITCAASAEAGSNKVIFAHLTGLMISAITSHMNEDTIIESALERDLALSYSKLRERPHSGSKM